MGFMSKIRLRRPIIWVWTIYLFVAATSHAWAHLISINTGHIVIRDADVIVMIAARKGLEPPSTNDTEAQAKVTDKNLDPIAVFRSNFVFKINGREASFAEDMLLDAEPHENQVAQIDWVARFLLPPERSEPSCYSIAVKWLKPGENLYIKFKMANTESDMSFTYDHPISQVGCDQVPH